jgi:hypothetical protein
MIRTFRVGVGAGDGLNNDDGESAVLEDSTGLADEDWFEFGSIAGGT